MFIKKILSLSLVLLNTILNAQTFSFESYKNNHNYKVKLLEDSTIEIYNKQLNYTLRKNIALYEKYENTTEANLIISLDTINFANYDKYYRVWGRTPLINHLAKFISIDANRNGKNEIYGTSIQYDDSNRFFYEKSVYENFYDSVFKKVFVYPDSFLLFYDISDITGDGLYDIASAGLKFYKQDSPNDLITTLNFSYNPFPSVYQFNDVTFYDIDGDGVQEIIYYLFAGDGDSVWAYSNHIAKYNPQINNYELIYYHKPQPDYFTSGISIGDFDQDGKGNFATGSIDGKLYIYEFVQGNQYKVEFTKELETFNAFLTTMTDDMDGNGKPELWIGGDFSSSGYGGITRLFAFESGESGTYNQVYQIDIRGLFSGIYGNMNYVDLDGDGKKELFVTNANLAFGFKNDGIGNYYLDFVIAVPKPDSTYVYRMLENVDVADIDGDSIVEIIPQYRLNKGWSGSDETMSIFLKREKITSVEDEFVLRPENYELYQNYPNPFNPITNIVYQIPKSGFVQLKVYDILGKEVAVLVNEVKSEGSYSVRFDASDLPSGIYIYSLRVNDFIQNNKMTLLK